MDGAKGPTGNSGKPVRLVDVWNTLSRSCLFNQRDFKVLKDIKVPLVHPEIRETLVFMDPKDLLDRLVQRLG